MPIIFNHGMFVAREGIAYSMRAPKTKRIQASIHASIAVRPSAFGVNMYGEKNMGDAPDTRTTRGARGDFFLKRKPYFWGYCHFHGKSIYKLTAKTIYAKESYFYFFL